MRIKPNTQAFSWPFFLLLLFLLLLLLFLLLLFLPLFLRGLTQACQGERP